MAFAVLYSQGRFACSVSVQSLECWLGRVVDVQLTDRPTADNRDFSVLSGRHDGMGTRIVQLVVW